MIKFSGNVVFGLVLFVFLGLGCAEEASIENFPYVASIQAPGFRGRRHVCNGAIINENWVLTTGGCVLHFEDPHAFKVHVGSTKYFDGEDYTVVHREFHPLFSTTNQENNFALLQVQTPLKFNDRTKSIHVSSNTSPIRAEQTYVLAGWGYSSTETRYPVATFNSLSVVILEKSECGTDGIENKLCARIVTEPVPTDMCNGAAGTPLEINNKLVALSPHGLGCEQETNTNFVLITINAGIKKWISETTK